MKKVIDFVKEHVKATLVVAVLGVAVTVGLTQDGCDVKLAPAVEAPAK